MASTFQCVCVFLCPDSNNVKCYSNFNSIQIRMNISQSEMLRTKGDRTAPIRTPTHIGCAFAIDRKFFFEIGSYDTGMDIWGGENVEMAFRVS